MSHPFHPNFNLKKRPISKNASSAPVGIKDNSHKKDKTQPTKSNLQLLLDLWLAIKNHHH